MFTKDVLFMYSKSILLVDDSPFFITLGKEFFRREQVVILTAGSGPEAVEIVKAEQPDLVFMDLYMTGGDGDCACREIKSNPRLRSTPVILVTSSNSPADRKRCLEAGCNEIIHKPLNREGFLAASRRHLKFPGWSGKRVGLGTPARFWIEPDKMMTGAVADMSVGGVFLETEHLFPVDTGLVIDFQLYPNAIFRQSKARVAWLHRRGSLKKDYRTTGMGLEFIDINKLDILSIQARVRNDSTAIGIRAG